jgi:hypothetical protein
MEMDLKIFNDLYFSVPLNKEEWFLECRLSVCIYVCPASSWKVGRIKLVFGLL